MKVRRLEGWKVKRKTSEIITSSHKISGRDYYQIFISCLMVILGAIILFRSFTGGINPMPLFVGGGFLGLGIYRLNFVVKYFWVRRAHRKSPNLDP